MNKILKSLSLTLLIAALLATTLPVYAEGEAEPVAPIDTEEIAPLSDETDEPAAPFAGSGTELDPYLISTPEDLVELAELTNAPADDTVYEDAYYKITNDIDMTDVTNFYGIARKESITVNADESITYSYKSANTTFKGTIDGDGHIISNLTVDRTNNTGANGAAALVVWASGATIKNLGLSTVTMTAGKGNKTNCHAGGFVAIGNPTVENCFLRGTVTLTPYGTSKSAAFIAAYNSGAVIRNCYSTISGVLAASMNGSDKTITVKNVYVKAGMPSSLGAVNGMRIDQSGYDLEAFIAAAGRAFVSDTNDINGGFPILRWETQRISDGGVVIIGDFVAQADGTYDLVIKNCYTGPLSAAAAVVFYDGDNMMLGAKVYGDTSLESGDTIEEADASISGVADAVSARIFLWNTLSGQELNDCLEYKILSE